MDYKQLLGILRAMAWQRAKGELLSMLETFVNDREKFETLMNEMNTFIQKVEDYELDK